MGRLFGKALATLLGSEPRQMCGEDLALEFLLLPKVTSESHLPGFLTIGRFSLISDLSFGFAASSKSSKRLLSGMVSSVFVAFGGAGVLRLVPFGAIFEAQLGSS